MDPDYSIARSAGGECGRYAREINEQNTEIHDSPRGQSASTSHEYTPVLHSVFHASAIGNEPESIASVCERRQTKTMGRYHGRRSSGSANSRNRLEKKVMSHSKIKII